MNLRVLCSKVDVDTMVDIGIYVLVTFTYVGFPEAREFSHRYSGSGDTDRSGNLNRTHTAPTPLPANNFHSHC